MSVKAAAESYGIAYVDLQAILTQASTGGIVFDDYTLDQILVTGGLSKFRRSSFNSKRVCVYGKLFLNSYR